MEALDTWRVRQNSVPRARLNHPAKTIFDAFPTSDAGSFLQLHFFLLAQMHFRPFGMLGCVLWFFIP
jgi:hypothetical protein